ncbi:MAG TPA: cobalamin-dependent protein [Candidatus Omnitrophota bacterium]|nr:cobalamin-dependent protein [Candidatus Omnitrophota bacterium]HPT39188.1 cobalamin-dependent protein [Candidatus Omnitrophota bacterium]
MKSDILFFNPPQTKRGDSLQNRALLWIASYLRKNGFRARIFYLNGNFKETIKQALNQYKPEHVAVSCKWYTNLYGAILVAKEVRRLNRKIRIITGGHTATCFDQELLETGYFDFVVRGDAEMPLLSILNNEAPVNCSIINNGRVEKYGIACNKSPKKNENYILSPPEQILENATEVLSGGNYIWTGKGCSRNCFYCGGSSRAQKKFFGKSKVAYRPRQDVLADISTLSGYSNYLMFDFACGGQAEAYYLRLFRKIPHKQFKVNFFHWGMPSEKFINEISLTFSGVSLHLDTATLSENLRKILSKKKLLKPFFTNRRLENVIKHCDIKRNIRISIENIAGLPGENEKQVKEHIAFSKYLSKKYISISDISYIPLSAEPGSLLRELHEKLNLNLCRNNFGDFVYLAKQAFQANITYPFSDFFNKKPVKDCLFSPYGVYQKESDMKTSYLRSKVFRQAIARELRANHIACLLYK